MAEEFNFPEPEGDDVELTTPINLGKGEDIEVEIVDDTPAQDRNREPLNKEVEDPTEDELQAYSESVKKRINELTHSRHDERRAREAAEREKKALEDFSRRLVEENNRLKQFATSGQELYGTTLESAAQSKVQIAKDKLKKAHEDFDTDAFVAAQEELLQAQMELAQAKQFKATPLQMPETPVYSNQQPIVQQQAPVDEKTSRWLAKNPWFGDQASAEHEEMTAVAMLAHKNLVNNGVDPRSDEYFKQIDARLRSRFPEYFGATKTSEPATRKSSVVAPVSRGTGKKSITLTRTEANIAKRLGLTNEQYYQYKAALGKEA